MGGGITKQWLDEKLKEGKIRGYTDSKEQKDKKNKIKLPKQKPRSIIWLDLNLDYWCRERSLTLEKEYKFSSERKYRSDYFIKELNVLLEFEGGVFMAKGGHNSSTGIQRDISKYKLAHELGFAVLRYTAVTYKKSLVDLSEIYNKRK